LNNPYTGLPQVTSARYNGARLVMLYLEVRSIEKMRRSRKQEIKMSLLAVSYLAVIEIVFSLLLFVLDG